MVLALACGVLSLGSALALAAVSAWLITRAWQMPPILDLSVAVVAVRAFGISRGVLQYCERLASHDVALRAAGSARAQLYRRLAHGPADTVARLHSGELLGRVGADVDELADVLVRALLPIGVAVVLSIAAVGVIAVISPAAALILALCLLIAGVIAPWLSARGAAAQEQLARRHHAERDIAAMTALEHAPELRVSGTLPALIAESEQQHRDWGRALDLAARPSALGAAVPTAALGISVLGAIAIGIDLASGLAPTTLAILMLLPLSSFEASSALPAAAIQLTRSRIAARRIFELAGTAEPSEPGQHGPAPTDFTLYAAVTTGHSATRPNLVLDLELAPGARVAITGPSGCGKTTALMTLAGLLRAVDGQIRLGDHPLTAYAESDVRHAISFFAEDAHIFDTTVRDNLLVVRGDCTDDELHTVLKKVGLGGWLDALPDGLATVLCGGAAALSAGQRRRLLLARALLSHSPVLLLDEPTEHLDIRASDALLRELLSPTGDLLPPDRTVVVATHHAPADIDCLHLEMLAKE